MISLFRRHMGLFVCAGILSAAPSLLAPAAAIAQQNTQLPEAPSPTGTLHGLVTDIDGALVSGAQITFTSKGSTLIQRSITSDSAGRYTLPSVPAGPFQLDVAAPGLAPTSTTGTLAPGQALELPTIQLRVATATTEVEVNLPPRELAQADVEEEEKQRAFYVFPNFLVSYNKTFTPLDTKQKFSLGWHVVLDPTHFIGAGIGAAIQFGANSFPGYGQDAAGYGQRYGALLATTTTATLLRASVFPAIFHQDPRYFYKGTGSKLSRAGYALSTAVISKGDNGKWQPAYASIGANFAAGAISNLYYAPSDRKGASLTVDNALLSIGFVGVGHLLQEFLFEKITKHGKHLPPPTPPTPKASATSQPTAP